MPNNTAIRDKIPLCLSRHYKEQAIMKRPINLIKFTGGRFLPTGLLIVPVIIMATEWKIYAQGVVAIKPDQPAQVKATGPQLTPKLTVTRRGRTLRMDYQLIGPDGKNRLRSSSFPAPQVAIYQGDRLVASGTFRYG
jgi:hypothetical protein